MTSKATHLLLQSLFCMLLSFFCQAQQQMSKGKSQLSKATAVVAAQQLKEERALNDSLNLLMESPPYEHPILQQIEHHRTESIVLFSNPVEDALVVACAIDKKSLVAFFFTTFGRVSDFLFMDRLNYQAVVETKTANIFELYTRYISRNIEQINKASDELRLWDTDAPNRSKGSPWLHLGVIKEAKTPLEKLLVLDVCREVQIKKWTSIHQKIICYDAADSVEKSFHSSAYRPGTCRTVGAGDSTSVEYFNKNPFCPIERAVVVPAKAMVFLYDQKHGGRPIDSFAVKKERVEEMLVFKTNPFVLYRGYLEWQLQKLRDYLAEAEKRQKAKGKTNQAVQMASFSNEEEQYWQWHQAALWERHFIRSINYLMLPGMGMMAVDKNRESSRKWNKSRQEWMPRQEIHTFVRGEKRYELTDHRGNVVAVLSDRKTGVDNDKDGSVEYFEPEVVSVLDYNPYGAPLPGRSTHVRNYRYGYNGKENDNEVKGEGNQQDYGMRIYDPRLGRFLSVDPIARDYPELTPYQFASNTPIQAIDLDGLEMYNVHLKTYQDSKGVSRFKIDHQDVDDGFWTTIGIAVRAGPDGGPSISFNYIYNGGQIEIIDPTKEKVLNFWRNVTPENFGQIAKHQYWDRAKGVIIGGIIDAAVGTTEAFVNSKTPIPQASGTTPTQRANAQAARAISAKVTIASATAKMLAVKGKTTTLVGRLPDLHVVSRRLDNVKSGKNDGGFNVLRMPDEYYTIPGNMKWLQRAIDRNDIIKAVSDPDNINNVWVKGIVGGERTIFGDELKLLEQNKYKYDPKTQTFQRK